MYQGLSAFGTFLYPGLIALGPQLYLGLAFGTILYPIMKMYPGFAAFGSFVLGGSCPGYIFVLWAGHPGYVFVLGAGRPGYVFVLGAGRPELAFQVILINPWLAWGWQPLVQKSTLGSALGTNRCSGQATPGTRGMQIMTLAQFQLQNLYCYVSRHHTPRKSTIGILDLLLHKSIYKIKIKRDLSC